MIVKGFTKGKNRAMIRREPTNKNGDNLVCEQWRS